MLYPDHSATALSPTLSNDAIGAILAKRRPMGRLTPLKELLQEARLVPVPCEEVSIVGEAKVPPFLGVPPLL